MKNNKFNELKARCTNYVVDNNSEDAIQLVKDIEITYYEHDITGNQMKQLMEML